MKVFLQKINNWITWRGNRFPITDGKMTNCVSEKQIKKDIDEFYKTHKLEGSCEPMSKYMSKKYGFGIVKGSLHHNKKGNLNNVQSHYINKGFNGELYDFSSPRQYKTSKNDFIVFHKVNNNMYSNKKVKIKYEMEMYDKMENDNELVIFLKGE